MEEGASLAEVARPLRIEWPEKALSVVGDDTRALGLPFATLGLAIQRWELGVGRRRAAESGRRRWCSLNISYGSCAACWMPRRRLGRCWRLEAQDLGFGFG